MTLTEIGIKFNTDKATYHKYTDFYETHLSFLKDKKISLLEIGVLYGSSVKMWEEYFQQGIIFGADIEDKSVYKAERINIIQLNQENEKDLNDLKEKFDVIIDDGGHTMLQQQLTLKVLLPKVKPGGIYILEDLHTSLPGFETYGCTSKNNTLQLLKDLKNKNMSLDNNYFISSNDFNILLKIISNIEIYERSNQSITSLITIK